MTLHKEQICFKWQGKFHFLWAGDQKEQRKNQTTNAAAD